MAYDRDRQSDLGGTAVVILLVLLLGILVLAAGGFLYWQADKAKRQELMARDVAMAAEMAARQSHADFQRMQEHNRLQPESDPDNADAVDGQQITIALDKDGNVSVDGNSMQPDDLKNKLRTMSDESSGHLSVVIQVDDRCRFECQLQTVNFLAVADQLRTVNFLAVGIADTQLFCCVDRCC